MKQRRNKSNTCQPKLPLAERPLLSFHQASQLEGLFKVLANDTRLRLLHALTRAGELNVGELCEALEMKPQAISNQLQRLADQDILDSRREGNSIFYRIIDPCITTLLDRGLCLSEDSKGRTK